MRSTITLLGLLTLPALAQEPPKVVVVAIDAQTEAALGPFGGSYRAHNAKVITALDQAGAKAIGFAVSFGENPQQAEGTRAMARAIDASKAPVVVVAWTEEKAGKIVAEPNAAALRRSRARVASAHAQAELIVESITDASVEARTGERVVHARAGDLPALPLEVLAAAGIATEGLIEQVTVGVTNGVEQKVDAIRPGPADGITTVSYADLLAGEVDPALLKDALVVVGRPGGESDVMPLAAVVQRGVAAAAPKPAEGGAVDGATRALGGLFGE